MFILYSYEHKRDVQFVTVSKKKRVGRGTVLSVWCLLEVRIGVGIKFKFFTIRYGTVPLMT